MKRRKKPGPPGGIRFKRSPSSAEPGVERLPAPEVTATALSIAVPTMGALVRYEQLLIDADQTFAITIDARRRLRR